MESLGCGIVVYGDLGERYSAITHGPRLRGTYHVHSLQLSCGVLPQAAPAQCLSASVRERAGGQRGVVGRREVGLRQAKMKTNAGRHGAYGLRQRPEA